MLIPLALLGVILGSPAWGVLVALFGAVMAWEWSRICNRGRLGPSGVVIILAVPAAVATAAAGAYGAAFVLLLAGALLGILVARFAGEQVPGWRGAGALYVGVPCIAILWLRADPVVGLETLLWLLALVWATDTGAYVAGRTIGGARLAPRISPGKTWAGLAGGMLSAAAVGLVAALLLAPAAASLLVGVSAALGLIEQAGDLAESAIKRRFAVKDSSDIIPGHGGVLDRLDGLLAVVVAVATLALVGQGSVLLWR